MKTILVLFIYGMGGATPAIVQTPYETAEACAIASKAWNRDPSWKENGPVRSSVCIPAPQ